MYHFLCVLASLSLTSQPPLRQPADGGLPAIAAVRFGDGSLVKMTMRQPDLEVMTKYGKLTIPFSDIRRIELGLHLPEGVGSQIQSAIRRLGSDIYKQREEAIKDLVDLGHFAFPSLEKAAQSGDLEVAQRANAIRKRINEKVPAEDLHIKDHDTIQTVEFQVTGRIISPTIKAHSIHFGELVLKLPDLRTMQFRGGQNAIEFTLDATKYGSAVDQWFDTGFIADSHTKLTIKSDGQVDLWPQGRGQYVTGPKGYTVAGKGGTYMAGTLVGRIGATGKTFVVGEQSDSPSSSEGRLYLHIVPSPWGNLSSGNYRVRINTDFASTAR